MNRMAMITNAVLVLGLFTLASCGTENKMPPIPAMPAASAAAAKAPAAKAKAKVQRASGNIGLLDTEKNYLILVTKEGKLITLDFDQKTKITQVTPKRGKIADIGLGSAATVTYRTSKGKNVASAVEYKVKARR